MSIVLSVVMPAYNQAVVLPASLPPLLAQTLPADAYEVIVVDDGSSDDTPRVLADMQPTDGRLRVLTLPVNRGRSGARNAGIAAARGRIVVFVDSDIVVREDFLACHLEMHREHGGWVVSRGPVVPVAAPAEVPKASIPPLAASPAYLNTTNAGVPAEALKRAGWFDEAFPGYGWEDFELGIRLKQLGLRRVFRRRAVAFHIEPPPRWTAAAGPEQRRRVAEDLARETERAHSAVYFFHKHPVWETRLLIQATAVHHAAYWLQTGGGLITADTVGAVGRRLQRRGWLTLAALLYRGVLNRHYLGVLEHELTKDAQRSATDA
jgi:glycosyltransferase involved in cell wall biosynthesis